MDKTVDVISRPIKSESPSVYSNAAVWDDPNKVIASVVNANSIDALVVPAIPNKKLGVFVSRIWVALKPGARVFCRPQHAPSLKEFFAQYGVTPIQFENREGFVAFRKAQ